MRDSPPVASTLPIALFSGGKELRFTQLCIACGASPDVILEHPLVLGVRDSHSIEELAARLTSDLPVLVVGNGAIAVELVHAVSIKGSTFLPLACVY